MRALDEYRADIDGLRALAVLSVVLHHLSANLVPGGFVGVDVFFVISGYLISLHLVESMREKTFTFSGFYQRRINRIVPALFVVVLLSCVAGLIILSPSALTALARSAVFSMLGLSNIHFWIDYGNYFGGNAAEAPLLHTWSLGVEEQFYFLWPIFIYLIVKIKWRLEVLSLLVCLGVWVSSYGVNHFISASYYLLPTRFFELALGGALAVWLLEGGRVSANWGGPARALGLGLIVFSLIHLNKEAPFPGYNALIPCVGAALIIAAGTAEGGIYFGLKHPVVVFFGLISYSLYLWHWPIIAFMHFLELTEPAYYLLAFIAATLFAWLSWKYVEKPFRRSGIKLNFGRTFAARLVFPAAIIFGFFMVCVTSHGLAFRYDDKVYRYEQMMSQHPNEIRAGCHVPTQLYKTLPDPQRCVLGDKKANVDGMVIGDSFANHFTGMIDILARASHLSVMDYTMDGCPPILDYSGGRLPAAYVRYCQERNKFSFDYIASHHFSFVILAASWPEGEEAKERILKTIEKARSISPRVVLIVNNPGTSDPDCPVKSIMWPGRNLDCSIKQPKVSELWTEIHEKYPDVYVIDPTPVFCQDHKCNSVVDDVVMYRDMGHLNDVGSRYLGTLLLKRGVTLVAPQQATVH